jgi:hypothetical protein
MPVYDAFRSRREGKRGLRTFCGFAWHPAGVWAPEGGGCSGLPWQCYEPRKPARCSHGVVRAGARTALGRQAGPSGRYGLRAGGRSLLCSGEFSRVVETDRTGKGSLRTPHPPGAPTSRPPQPRAGPACPGRLRTAGQRSRNAGQAGARLPLPTGAARRKSAAVPGTARRPAVRPPPPSCPMWPGALTYHHRDNVPGQIRARIGPLDHPPRSPRGQGPCDRTRHAT